MRWVRPSGDWLSCVSEDGENETSGVDPHEAALGGTT